MASKRNINIENMEIFILYYLDLGLYYIIEEYTFPRGEHFSLHFVTGVSYVRNSRGERL